MKIIVAITGASGAIYGYSLIRSLHQLGIDTYIIATEAGQKVMAYECGISPEELSNYGTVYSNADLFAPVASGSFKTDGMAVIPCSMNTLGAMAGGIGDTLLSRAAGVMLKEKRRLVIVPRETPLHLIHLENMLRLARAGADIMPAAPGFYNRPTQIWELVNFMNARVLDAFGIEHSLMKRWGEG
ncbi:UbiX family flavin prenyltransferase [Paenibacillus sp. NFR01]|uniref:UbiX family flavin prenyltransferase n=1 Tax=Paenibacillus sp. NFR01 TaxID=1566279 RepID=UPI0008B2D529|nr:flavin prenyltransferase UbiX [Paenibacillus sp. NFR01]SEU20945.1 4-hydroxy-3-polyprenylbenzoate decarboxylase [Paenibacillus sp. NFR01]